MPRRATDRERGLTTDITWFEVLAEEAQEAGSYQAAVTGRSKAVALRETYHRIREARLRAPDPADPLEVVRFAAQQAEAEGSWQASARLRSQESSLVIELRKLEAQRAAAELTELDESQLMDLMHGIITELPSELVQSIRDMASERLGAARSLT